MNTIPDPWYILDQLLPLDRTPTLDELRPVATLWIESSRFAARYKQRAYHCPHLPYAIVARNIRRFVVEPARRATLQHPLFQAAPTEMPKKLLAAAVACVGDITRYKHPSALWKALGILPIPPGERYTPTQILRRKRLSTALYWNPRHGTYSRFYQHQLARITASTPYKQRRIAIWRTVRLYLSHALETARLLENLPPVKPYCARLGHYYPPHEFGWKLPEMPPQT